VYALLGCGDDDHAPCADATDVLAKSARLATTRRNLVLSCFRESIEGPPAAEVTRYCRNLNYPAISTVLCSATERESRA
jgi:hypothetical protein